MQHTVLRSVLNVVAIGVPSAVVALAFAGAVEPALAIGAAVGGLALAAAANWPPRPSDRRSPEPRSLSGSDLPTEEEIVHTDQVESLGLLAGGIAHDFNNLLTGILGNTAIALAEIPDGAAREAILDAEVAARRAKDLVAQLLAYSGRGVLERRPIDLPAMVKETRGLLGRVLSPKAKVEIHGREDLAIEGDPAQVRQVVMNLLTNASDALGEREGRIVARVTPERLSRRELDKTLLGRELDPGRFVRFEVRDTGCGMDADTVQRMFEPYFTTKSNGRGLGLAALLGIVRHHRGTAQVESIVGAGTKVVVWFPAPATPVVVPLSDPGQFAAPAERSGKVLLAEDEEMVRRVASRMLSKLGYDVVAVSDGRQAVDHLARDEGYALALIDVQMPGVDGRQVLRHLREQRPKVPAVLMTGYTPEDVTGGSQPDAWLRKPFSLKDLMNAVDTAQIAGGGA